MPPVSARTGIRTSTHFRTSTLQKCYDADSVKMTKRVFLQNCYCCGCLHLHRLC